MLLANLVEGMTIGSLYALMALGLSLVYGILRVLDIANAGAYTLGAYVGVLTWRLTSSWWLALLAGAAVASGLGWLLQRHLYVPILASGPIVPLIASIGVFTALEEAYRLLFGPYILKLPARIPLPTVRIAGTVVSGVQLLVLMVAVAAFAGIALLLDRTRTGLAWRATAQDRETAEAMGIDVGAVTGRIFLLGYALAAAAGVLVAIHYNAVSPTMGDMPAYKMLAIIVLGGLGSPFGTVAASLLIGLVETFVAAYVGFLLPRDAIAFAALILILLLRPQGLFARGVAAR
ncbi:MAG: branched-chain amino acid ABC transporter permease [Bacillota bacterium]|nr:branched-chain amino acid ABC transporter permease [Bacillota bacterium]